jgi:hypothetical protein
MAKKVSETTISKEIRDALDSIGIWNIRIQSGMLKIGNRFIHLAPKGTSDILLPSYDKQGHSAWLEVKTDTGTLSPDQVKFQEKAESFNVKTGVVRSAKEAIELVQSWIKGKNNDS